MAAQPFLSAIEQRRSLYALTNKSPIPDSRITEIVTFAIKNCPSPFNVQSSRAVTLFRAEHEKLWDLALEQLKSLGLPPGPFGYLAAKVAGFRAALGTVMWFEDQASLDGLAEKQQTVKHILPEWSDHSTGMHQFTVWTALEAEGLGCNLQHYNMFPAFGAEVLKTWALPETWKLKAQLVFGQPTAGPDKEKVSENLEDRARVFG